jgi:hypothetical protein
MMGQDIPGEGNPPPEKEEIVAGIEQTRHDLAETVEALAAKVDVPSRVREKTVQVRGQVSDRIGTLTQTARDKAPQVRASLAKAGDRIPEPARRTTQKATDAAARRPAILYAAAGLCTAAGLWLWTRGRRS